MPKRNRELVQYTDNDIIEITIQGQTYKFDSIVNWQVYAERCKYNPENAVFFLYIQTPTDEHIFTTDEHEIIAIEEELEML